MNVDQALAVVALHHHLGMPQANVARVIWFTWCVRGAWAPPMVPDWEAEGARLVSAAEGCLGYPPGTLQPGGGPLPQGGMLP